MALVRFCPLYAPRAKLYWAIPCNTFSEPVPTPIFWPSAFVNGVRPPDMTPKPNAIFLPPVVIESPDNAPNMQLPPAPTGDKFTPSVYAMF